MFSNLKRVQSSPGHEGVVAGDAHQGDHLTDQQSSVLILGHNARDSYSRRIIIRHLISSYVFHIVGAIDFTCLISN
jgi:hypothetical protein